MYSEGMQIDRSQLEQNFRDLSDDELLARLADDLTDLARVMDSDTIYANGVLFGSLTLGGVRVMVPESQLDAALAIRAAFDAGELAIDEDYDVGKGS
jgi:hypothetical protein